MSQPRIPPRPAADWDAEVLDALSVRRPPRTARPAASPAASPAANQEASQAAAPAGSQPAKQQPAARGTSNMLGIFSWHPALTKAFLVFNNHLFGSTLSDRVRELVTVRACWLRRGEYEWAQHARMARTAGLTQQEIDAISEGPGSPVWEPLDAALLRAVDEIIADRYIGDETWQQLAEHLDREQLMDLVFTVGNYDLLCMAFNTFGLQLDPGLAGFPPASPDPSAPPAPPVAKP